MENKKNVESWNFLESFEITPQLRWVEKWIPIDDPDPSKDILRLKGASLGASTNFSCISISDISG